MHQTISAYVPANSLNCDKPDESGKPEGQQKGYELAECSLHQEAHLRRAQFGFKAFVPGAHESAATRLSRAQCKTSYCPAASSQSSPTRSNHVCTLVHNTVKSLAHICSSTTSTMFSEPCFKQTHTARQRLIKRKGYYFGFLGTN